MKFNDFRLYFSDLRTDRYLAATHQSKSKCIKLYKANLMVAQAFHPLLGIFEVVLRNQLNEILTAHFADANWIINQKTGFMSDPSLKYIHKRTGQIKTNDFLKNEIQKAERRLYRMGAFVTSGKVIAEQTLGFWTDLFEVHHYRLLKGKPIQIFQSLPAEYGRKEVNEELDKVRRFRNRINHNEPVCFCGSLIDFTNALSVYHSIINILAWINPSLIQMIKNLDKVQKTIDAARNINNMATAFL